MALSVAELLSGVAPASWRGIEFHVPNVRGGAGRRVQSFLFPGLDYRVHQDLGALDGPLSVPGLIVGDDYVQRAQQLQEAFRTAGPATLVHPWLGELKLVLINAPEIELDWKRLRVASFSASFEYFREAPEPAFDVLGLLLLAAEGLKSTLRGLLAELLAPLRLGLGIVNAVASFGLWVRAGIIGLVGGLTNGGALLGLLSPQLAGLVGLGSAAGDASYGASVADALDGAPALIAGTALPAATPAIAAGGDAGTDTTLRLDAAVVADALLAMAAWTPPPAIVVPAGVLVALRGYALAAAIAAGARQRFISRQAALAWRARADAAIAAAQRDVAAMAGDAPGQVAATYQALAGLRQALARDISAGLGRLPAVRRLTVPNDCTAWAVANHLAGADARLIRPIYDDLVVRNGLDPAVVRAGAVLEYLA
jgi:prophage DNA circulation protein